MNKIKQRIELAKIQGINTEHYQGFVFDHGGYKWEHFNTLKEAIEWNKIFPSDRFETRSYTCVSLLPDYLNDLDAIHKVEKVLFTTGDSWCAYFEELENVCGEDNDPITATAEQRAEAILKTIGKWEEQIETSKNNQ